MKKENNRGRSNVAAVTRRNKVKGCKRGDTAQTRSSVRKRKRSAQSASGETVSSSVAMQGVDREVGAPSSGVNHPFSPAITVGEAITTRRVLKAWFPWLGIDKDSSRADTVDRLNDLYTYLNV